MTVRDCLILMVTFFLFAFMIVQERENRINRKLNKLSNEAMVVQAECMNSATNAIRILAAEQGAEVSVPSVRTRTERVTP